MAGFHSLKLFESLMPFLLFFFFFFSDSTKWKHFPGELAAHYIFKTLSYILCFQIFLEKHLHIVVAKLNDVLINKCEKSLIFYELVFEIILDGAPSSNSITRMLQQSHFGILAGARSNPITLYI